MEEKAVVASIQDVWCEKIFSSRHQKCVEIRKNRPKLQTPFKVFVYCTKQPAGKDTLWLATPDEVVSDGEAAGDLVWVGKDLVYTAGLLGLVSVNGTVLGEFTCDRIEEFRVLENGSVTNWMAADLDKSCLAYQRLAEYIGIGNTGYAWHISAPVLYEKPKAITDLLTVDRTKSIKNAPQSWVYCAE